MIYLIFAACMVIMSMALVATSTIEYETETDWVNEADAVLNEPATGAAFVDAQGNITDVSQLGYSCTR